METGKYIEDHTLLIESALDIIEENKNKFEVFKFGNTELLNLIDYKKECPSRDYVVLGEDTALELGSPDTHSVNRLFWTRKPGLVKNRSLIINNSLKDLEKERVSFMQLVFIEIDDSVDPYDSDLYRLKNLTKVIPGLMTRSQQNKIWIRINRELMKKNITLRAIGEAVAERYMSRGAVSVEIVLIAHDDIITEFHEISTAAEVLSRSNRKQRWIEDGVISCEDLDCSSCSEKVYCDTLKQIAVKKKEKRRSHV